MQPALINRREALEREPFSFSGTRHAEFLGLRIMDYVIGGVIAIVLTGYLVYALLYPERF